MSINSVKMTKKKINKKLMKNLNQKKQNFNNLKNNLISKENNGIKNKLYLNKICNLKNKNALNYKENLMN